jgi:hypothetical protein
MGGVSRVGRCGRVVRVFNVKCVPFLFAPRPRGGTTRGSIRDGFGSSCRPCRRVYVPAGRGSAAEPGARTWSPCRSGRRPCSTRNTGTCTRVAHPGGLHPGSGRPRVFPSTSEGLIGSLCARRVARCDAGDARGSERSRARHSRVPEGDAPSADSRDTTSPKNFWRQINTSHLPRSMTVLHVQSVVHLAGSHVWSH